MTRKIFFTLFFTLLSVLVRAQQVNISLSVLPPYPAHFTDFLSHPQQVVITVQNNTFSTQNVQLRGTLTGDNGISIRMNPQARGGSPLVLKSREVRNLSALDLSGLFDYSQIVFSGITKDKLIRLGGLPEGDYQLCARAYDYYTNLPLSGDQPQGCSNYFSVTSVEPPVITAPQAGAVIASTGAGQNFLISWATPAGAPATTQYTVKIVEILDNRSPQNAMYSATTPAFFQTTVMGNALYYGPGSPALTSGRRYALVVVAADPGQKVVFRNGGQSEVSYFDCVSTVPGTVLPNGPGGTPLLPPLPAVLNDEVTGQVTWDYKSPTSPAPLGGATVALYGSIGRSAGVVVQPIATTTTDDRGQYRFNLPRAEVLAFDNLQLCINHPSGVFNTVRRVVNITAGSATSFFLGVDQLTAQTYSFTPTVVCPDLPPGGNVTVNILMDAQVRENYSFLTGTSGLPLAHVKYNNADYVVLATGTSGHPYQQLLQGSGMGYVVQLSYPGRPSAYYPVPPASSPADDQGNRSLLQLAHEYTYRVGTLIGGTVAARHRVQAGVQITAMITGSNPASPAGYQAITDNEGNYQLDISGALPKGSPVVLTIYDGAVRQQAFTDTVIDNDSAYIRHDIDLTHSLYAVTGQVVDENNQPLDNALVTPAGGGGSVRTSAQGVYQVLAAATDTLVVNADGYQEKRVPVGGALVIPLTTGINGQVGGGGVNGVRGSSVNGLPGSGVDGLSGGGINDSVQGQIDLAAVSLIPFGGTVNLRLSLNNKNVRALISIVRSGGTEDDTIPGDPSWTYSTAAGTYFYTLRPFPGDSVAFSPFTGEFVIQRGITDTLYVLLTPAVALSGVITDNQTGVALDSSVVTVQGLPYQAVSSGGGKFTLYVPTGTELRVHVNRNAYTSADSAANPTRSGPTGLLHIKLSRVSAGMPTIGRLAGFPVTLDAQTLNADGTCTISGTLSLDSNAIFTPVAGYRTLTFRNALVKPDTAVKGNAVPVGDIAFEEAVLQTQAFGFAPVEVDGFPQLKLRQLGSSTAAIGGNQLVLKLSNVTSISSLPVALTDAVLKDTSSSGGGGKDSMSYVFASPGSGSLFGSGKQYALSFVGNSSGSSSLQGLASGLRPADSNYISAPLGYISSLFIQKNSATLSANGIGLNGYLQFPSLPGITLPDSGRIDIQTLTIGTNYAISALTVAVSDQSPLRVTLGKFQASLTKVMLTGLGTANFGMGFGGTVSVEKGDGNQLTINELSVTRGTSGTTLTGRFALPGSGLKVRSLVFKAAYLDLSYNTASRSFTLDGSGSLDYSSSSGGGGSSALRSIFPIQIQQFDLRSKDWAVYLEAAANLHVDFKVASLDISKLLVNVGYAVSMDQMNSFLIGGADGLASGGSGASGADTTAAMMDPDKAAWAIGIAGGIAFPIKSINDSIGGSLLIGDVGQGIQVKVNTIALKIDNPQFTLDASADMSFGGDSTGFSAQATLTAMSYGFDAGFTYYSYRSGGLHLAARLTVTAEIETGPILWHSIGGGFDFNTKTQAYSVFFKGDLGPEGTPKEVMYVKDANIAILFDAGNCGAYPVISGGGTLNMQTQDWATIGLEFDFCHKLMLVTIGATVPVCPGLSVYVSGVLYGMIKMDHGKASGSVFLAVNAQANFLDDIMTGNAAIDIGYNFNPNDPNTPDTLKSYYYAIDKGALDAGGVFNGIYIDGHVGIPNKNGHFALTVGGFDMFGLDYNFYVLGQAEMYYKYLDKKFYLQAKFKANAMAVLTVMSITMIGSAEGDALVQGGYDGSAWYANGKASLALSFYDDASKDCNSASLAIGSCCCSNISIPCCGNPLHSCFYDWSCSYDLCMYYPTMNFKVCGDLGATFGYRQGGAQV